MDLFHRILKSRGISDISENNFLNPDYQKLYDPMSLPDMGKAVDRLRKAKQRKEKILIYGDYDIDGLTATSLLMDGLSRLGLNNVDYFIPNRFSDGYGLSLPALKRLVKTVSLIITVDCGSLSLIEIEFINSKGVDVIVTDHHNIHGQLPPALAVINPKRADSTYLFKDLAGVGVVFKLIQALQSKLDGLPVGQEKWLLDLVCLGTICDSVPLIDENRILAYWGLEVLKKTRRPGLAALIEKTSTPINQLNSGSVGFRLGPRMNAAGRLETAESAMELLETKSIKKASKLAADLDDFNRRRQVDQAKIFKEAMIQADSRRSDEVLVLSSSDWSSGIIGIVASRLAEYFKKSVYIFQDLGTELKGSARSFGEFDVAGAIDACRDLVISGGGHKLAAGVSLETKNLEKFRESVNDYYEKKFEGSSHNIIREDAEASLIEINESVYTLISKMEPFGNGNPRPVIKTEKLFVRQIINMGSDNQYVKYKLADNIGRQLDFLDFKDYERFDIEVGDLVDVWFNVDLNEWRGVKTIQGKIIALEVATR